MDIKAALHPRCPNHPNMLIENHGVCVVCEMTTHRHLSGFRLFKGGDRDRVTYRSEAPAYDEGLEDND